MADLTISGADIGYDQAGLDTLITDIKTKVVDQAIEELHSARDNLVEELKPIWQGQSALNFVENMKDDIKAIEDALNSAREKLEAELSHITKAMTDIDQKLVKRNA